MNSTKNTKKAKKLNKEKLGQKKIESEEKDEYQIPSVKVVCNTFDLQDVEIEYNDNHYKDLITYKLYQEHVRPILQNQNPKAPMSKLMMLVAAKWRNFAEKNPNLQYEESEEEEELDHTPKPSCSHKDNKEEKEIRMSKKKRGTDRFSSKRGRKA